MSVDMAIPYREDNLIKSGTIYPTPPLGQDMTQGQFVSGV